MSAREGMICTDFENWLGHAKEDPILRRYAPAAIIQATASATEQEVRAYYPDYAITRRITAFAFPKLKGADPREVLDIEAAAEAARLCGYVVQIVDRAPDAADKAIVKYATDISFNRRFKLCIIATQDGKPPYADFLAQMKVRVRVHVIGFDRIPPSFGGEDTLPFSSLKERVFAILEQAPPVAPPRRSGSSRDAPKDAPPPFRHDPVRSIRESAHAFLVNPDSIADPQHYAWIEQALACTVAAVQEQWQGEFLHLVRSVQARWPGRSPPNRELEAILKVVLDRFFFRKSTFVYKPGEMAAFRRRFPGLAL